MTRQDQLVQDKLVQEYDIRPGKSLDLKIYIKPMGKPRMTQKDQHKPAHKRYWAYKDELRRLVGIPTWRFPPPIRLHIVAYIALPPSLSKKEIAERAGHWHRIVPDASNILKGVEDILFVKDEKIADVACKKYWESTGPFLSLLPSLELEVVW